MFCYIYKIVNAVNGKVYVGQTWQKPAYRFKAHQNMRYEKCLKLQSAMKKHGIENFKMHIITIAHTQEVADYWENYFIQHHDTITKGYNIRLGGNKTKLSEETKKKMSLAKLGKPGPWRNKKRQFTPEHKAKTAQSIKEWWELRKRGL